ncbi:hypothetical protein HPB50_026954 [Hyalomma asiaticum]|uniref:Uncharacterized protein n=1 Tax=Hyalomma asiaticum TaxID=266040 RepID=A0ACB7SC87_HYAAI|nr:hypothetical protein HPB50_026954 [Hyalomma asiaticum]
MDQEKLLVAADQLRDAAKAWERYEGVRQQSWAEWSTKSIAAFGRPPHAGHHHPTHGAAVPSTDTPSRADRAHERHRLGAAAVSYSPLTESITEHIAVCTDRRFPSLRECLTN